MTDKPKTEAEAVADLARTAYVEEVAASDLDSDLGGRFVIHRTDERTSYLDFEAFAPIPRTKRGEVTVHTIEALKQYAVRHVHEDRSTLWADVPNARLTVVLNDHAVEVGSEAGSPGWGDHRVGLKLMYSPEWNAWAQKSGQMMPQGAFADFLDERVVDVVEPDGALLLEIAQTFQATTSAKFRQAISRQSNTVKLLWEEDSDARAGTNGDVEIPRELKVRLRPFRGDEPVIVDGRFTYSVKEGKLTLGVKLLNLAEIVETAVARVAEQAASFLSLTVLEGVAPAPLRAGTTITATSVASA